MRHVDLDPTIPNIDYLAARNMAVRAAAQADDLEQPVLMAWHDGRRERMSPAIEGADVRRRWRDYGASHCGCLEISVGGMYDFIFADGAPYDDYGPSPYLNLSDARGRQYLCTRSALHDPRTPEPAACDPLDDYTSKLT